MCKCCGHCGKNNIVEELVQDSEIESYKSDTYSILVREDDGRWCLLTEIDDEVNNYHKVIRIPIYYCPICGRTLR